MSGSIYKNNGVGICATIINTNLNRLDRILQYTAAIFRVIRLFIASVIVKHLVKHDKDNRKQKSENNSNYNFHTLS